jgi:hypothetical protein
MSLNVEFQVVARFGKVDGARDYSWLTAQDVVPRHLLSLGETLAQVVASGKTFLSLVTETGGQEWLIRAYTSGVDNQFRPIAAAEVAQIVAPRPLPETHWLGLAVISIQQSERELIGGSNQFSIAIRPPQGEPSEPEEEVRVRARLGLPVATTTRVAASLLAPDTWNYKGICFAVRGKNDPAVEWIPELSPYLCINFTEPQLRAEEGEIISLVQRRPVSSNEWESLARLERTQLHQALSWSVNDNGPLRVTPSDSKLLEWLVAFRSGQLGGAKLLSTLLSDTMPQMLQHAFIEAATKGLPGEAAAFLYAVARGEKPETSLDVIELLAREGFLEDERVAPLATWIRFVKHSPVVGERALRKLEGRGCEPEAARFVLDLAPESTSTDAVVPQGLAFAARLAVNLGIEPPNQRLRRALKAAQSEARTRIVEDAAYAYGGWAESLVNLWLRLDLPPEGALTSQDMLIAVEARQAALDSPDELLQVLALLIRNGRATEAVELMTAAEASTVFQVSGAARQTILARLGLSPPVAPPQVQELSGLAAAGLVRPDDVVLTEADETQLGDYAQLWRSTAPLAGVLGEARGFEAELALCPSSWRGALRKAVTPARVGRWLARHTQKEAARQWVAHLHGLSGDPLEALNSGAEDAQFTPEWLEWLPALLASAPLSQRLRAVAALAKGALKEEDEARTAAFVEALLPDLGERGRGIVAHALTRVGPLPQLEGLSAEFLLPLLRSLDTVAVINAVFSSYDQTLSGSTEFCRALADSLSQQEAACPAHGYTVEQLRRHAPLAYALSSAGGWQHLAPDVEVRIRQARQFVNQLGLRAEDLLDTGGTVD